MNTGLDFTWAAPDDLAEVEAFHVRHFGADSVQALPGRVRWLYFRNPLGLHVALCRDGDRLVASCGHLPRLVNVGDETVAAGFGIDFMVDPAYRRRGIGRQFLALRRERFRLSLSTGQSPGMRALYAAEGGVELGPMFTGTHRRRPPLAAAPRALAKGWVCWLAGLQGASAAEPAEAGASWGQASARAATIAGDEAVGMWLRWRCDGPVYADHQAVSAAGGVAAVRREGKARIITALEARTSERVDLLAALAALPGARETRLTGAGRALQDDLQRAGFLVRPTSAVLVAMTMDDTLRRHLRPGSVDLDAAAGDADLLRRP